MKKYLILFMIALLLLGITGQVFANNYWNDVASVLEEIIRDESEVQQNVSRLINENITNFELRNIISDYKNRAFNQLEEMIILYSKAPDSRMHVDLTSIVSNWYLVNELLEEGLINMDVDKINSAGQILLLIAKKAENHTSELKRQK
jgi:hypothetical protein